MNGTSSHRHAPPAAASAPAARAQRPAHQRLARFYVVGFGVLMAFDTLAQISFKLAGEHALPLELSVPWLLRVVGQPWVYGALLGYAGAFFTWMTLLKHAPIGPAFAASHLEIVAVLGLSAWLFGERVGALQLLGAALIFAGIVCLAFSEARQPPAPAPARVPDGPTPPAGAAADAG
jgi:drug/metabolite transporter (DMT)-like permease